MPAVDAPALFIADFADKVNRSENQAVWAFAAYVPNRLIDFVFSSHFFIMP